MMSDISKFRKSTRGFGISLFLLGLIFVSGTVSAQEENAYVCTKGKIHFFSGTAMEDIEATSNSAVCVFNTQTKKIFAKIQQSSFVFKDKLMQEHFNENYMESEKYPYGVLDMLMDNVDLSKDGTFDVVLKGTLEMHGVKYPREIKAKLVIKNGQPVNATAVFTVKLADHKIKIPSIVGANIAEEMKVDIDFNFEKYKK
ncbi:MAG: YceI family protein [Bacteroidota bacterium]|nr:YceI family protein [Bacteroidota bacterium]